MRRAARSDDNQAQVVNSLRLMGYSVLVLSMVGKGCPDLCVGKNGKNWLFEIKDGDKSLSKQRLTKDEQTFFNAWRGQVHRACCVEDILAITRA